MGKITMLRTLIIYGLCTLALCLHGCSVFEKKPAAGTLAETEQTAYYTCGGCHGPKNVRVNYMTPNLIGQKEGYLAAKIRDFRDKKRINPYMNGVVSEMTDQDAKNLAAYYSNYGQGKK
jgi:cytochrome c553